MSNLPKRRTTELPAQPSRADDVTRIPDTPKAEADKVALLTALLRTEVHAEAYQGPLPHPDMLRQFNEVLPGLAERIISQWETQSAHRQNLEQRTIQNDILLSRLGLAAAFIVAILFLAAGFYLVVIGQAIAGTAFVTIDIASLVGAFIYATNNRSRERGRKAQIMADPGTKPKKKQGKSGRKVP